MDLIAERFRRNTDCPAGITSWKSAAPEYKFIRNPFQCMEGGGINGAAADAGASVRAANVRSRRVRKW
jgi:hypothetical protein